MKVKPPRPQDENVSQGAVGFVITQKSWQVARFVGMRALPVCRIDEARHVDRLANVYSNGAVTSVRRILRVERDGYPRAPISRYAEPGRWTRSEIVSRGLRSGRLSSWVLEAPAACDLAISRVAERPQ